MEAFDGQNAPASDPTVPPVVLLHAFPLDSRMFDGVAARLPGARLIAPDLPGFGGRPLPRGAPDLGTMAADVLSRLEDAGVRRAIVGGVSMGGYVALRMARDAPDRLAGLILADTRATADDARAAAARLARASEADLGRIADGSQAIAPLIAPGADERVRSSLASIAGSVPAETVAWAQRAMAARPDSTDVLASTSVPVLVLVGELDTVTPLAEASVMAEAAGTTPVPILGGGHLAAAECPDAFTQALTTWLREHWPTA